MTQAVVPPEIRVDLLKSLTHTCELWFRDLSKGFFEQPDSSFAKQLVLEAVAAALVNMAKNEPESTSIIETYVITLQEFLQEQRQ